MRNRARHFTVPALLLGLVSLGAGCGHGADSPTANEAAGDPGPIDPDAVAAFKVFLQQAKQLAPNPKFFKLVGTTPIPDPFQPVSAPKPSALDDEKDVPDGDLAHVETADGRMFDEIPGARPARTFKWPRARSFLVDGSKTSGEPQPDKLPLKSTAGVGMLQQKQLVGGDDRVRETSIDSRFVVRIQQVGSSRPLCSGTLIAARVVVTSAHCVDLAGDGTRDANLVVAPGARGASYVGTREPQGARDVVFYQWPRGWRGSGAKYDYAILVLSDLAPAADWSPMVSLIGYEDSSWLRDQPFYTRGYPGFSQTCADAAAGDGGLCSGYQYRQPGRYLHGVYTSYVTYDFDTQPAQSGSGIYTYADDLRVVHALHKQPWGVRNRGHRIREGSYGLICDTFADYPSTHFIDISCE